MKKFTTITPENIKLIAHRVTKFLERQESIECYSDWGWFPKYANKLGLSAFSNRSRFVKNVERTMMTYIIRETMSCAIMHFSGRMTLPDEHCFVIRPHKDSHIDTIKTGNKIRITPSEIIIKGVNPILKKSFTDYWRKARIDDERIKEIHRQDEEYANQYYADMEKEWETEDIL